MSKHIYNKTITIDRAGYSLEWYMKIISLNRPLYFVALDKVEMTDFEMGGIIWI